MKLIFRLFFFFGFFSGPGAVAQNIDLQWNPRKDLNHQLPASIKIYDALGQLPDGQPLRAMYAEIDLRDKNLKLRSIGSDTQRETTQETYHNNNGILAINGGYFASNTSVSLIIEDGELITSGTLKVPRGAFGMVQGKPEVVWTLPAQKGAQVQKVETPQVNKSQVWTASQAVGAGPVLLKNGKIEFHPSFEGFGAGHIKRHPRSAIGYKDQHTLIMMVVDGRQEASAGVTLPELAQLMLQVGATDAVNLDGGGSSAMVAADEVVNVPVNISGGDRNQLRKNAGALVISERISQKRNKPIYLDTEDEGYSEVGLWKNSNLPNHYGNSASRVALANAQNKAFYHWKNLPPQQYQLAAWFSVDSADNAKEVEYITHGKKGKDTIRINQSDLDHLGKWVLLGDFQLSSGDSLEVRSIKGGQFLTDALRLIPSSDVPEVPERGDLRIAVISDLNSGLGAIDYEWQVDSIIQRIPRIFKPDLVISGGDLVAGMGVSDPEHLQKMWDAFVAHIAAPLKNHNIPFAFTLGNHDGPRSYKIEHDFTQRYWRNSEMKPDLDYVDDTHFPNYYSFVKNNVFFVSWEASSPVITPENLAWMKTQFETPEARSASQRFVMGHMPLYSVAQERDSKGDVLQKPEELRSLLEHYGVSAYISGHQHAYYPGKRGKLELLNTGAAGSGARSWLTQDLPPTNTMTLMDVFKDGRMVYTTYEIKEQEASKMKIFEMEQLPSAIFGVNGYLLRMDKQNFTTTQGQLYQMDSNAPTLSKGEFSLRLITHLGKEKIEITGKFNAGKTNKSKNYIARLLMGRNGESTELLHQLDLIRSKKGEIDFKGLIEYSPELQDLLTAGALGLEVKGDNMHLRGQIYSLENAPPSTPEITSHHPTYTYGIRDLEVLRSVDWAKASDKDGDFVTYIYQMATDPEFGQIIFQKNTGRNQGLKFEEKDWFKLLDQLKIGEQKTFYHRVLATDGGLWTSSGSMPLHLLKSDEPLTDLAEVAPPPYQYMGKVHESGAGYGALWDPQGLLWLADYKGGLIIKTPEGSDAPFSPLKSVNINNEPYALTPVNGIGKDTDGNILAGINRHLIKIDAKTGEGIAVWEAPAGNRAITSPRAASDGTIYAASLFGEDPTFVLKQNGDKFELVRTLALKNRRLARTFDLSDDGHTLYFPDPGTAIVQVYTSNDGVHYNEEQEIRSLNAGSSALQVRGEGLFFAVRSSGITPSSFHYRNAATQKMWTMELPEVKGAEPRGIGVSEDGKYLIFCSWDQGGGYYLYQLKPD